MAVLAPLAIRHPLATTFRSVQSQVNQADLEQARELVTQATSIAVLTGAGISTDSGIPDFRGPNGVWTKNPAAEKKSNIQTWMTDVEYRKSRWQRLAAGEIWAKVDPNDGHRALLALEANNTLHTLVTQNVDGLHEAAGSSPDLIVEIHGTTRRVMCLDCDDGAPMERALERVRAGEEDPACKSCGGILKAATVSFGQSLPVTGLQRAEQAANECDVLLAVGTSLGVFPIANMVPIAAQQGAHIVIVNGEPTGFDDLATVIVGGSISDVLPVIVGAADLPT